MAKVTDVEKLILLYVYGPLSFQDGMPENLVSITHPFSQKKAKICPHTQCCAYSFQGLWCLPKAHLWHPQMSHGYWVRKPCFSLAQKKKVFPNHLYFPERYFAGRSLTPQDVYRFCMKKIYWKTWENAGSNKVGFSITGSDKCLTYCVWDSPKRRQYLVFPKSIGSGGLSWWSSGKASACQSRGHRFDSWSRKIPHRNN